MEAFNNKQLAKVQNNRNHLIDLLRFLAASGVILFHFNEPIPYIDNLYRELCKLGFLGVPIFFVISGYCIGIAENHSKKPSSFIIRRLFRIFPPYWFSVLLVIFSALAVKLFTGTNSTPLPKDISSVLATIFLYTTPLSHFKTINWVYWTLPFELFFYIIIFIVMFLPLRIKTIVLLIMSIIAIVLPIQTGNFLFFFNELSTFMLGYALYLIVSKGENIYWGVLLFIVSLLGIFFKHPGFEYPIVSSCVCLFIFIDSIKPLKNNFFSSLGDYSYSMYLIHVPIGIYLLGFIKNIKIVQTNIALNIIVDLSLLALIIFISRFTFESVELKSIEIGKRLSKSRNNKN